MDIAGENPQGYLADKSDLFSAVNELGAVKDEYVVEHDSYQPRFKRGDAWREAMRAIRK